MKLLKFLSLLGVVSLLVITMTCGPKRDTNKKLPDEVARDFVTSFLAKDFAKARAYWSPGSVANIEEFFGMSFEDYCRKRFDCGEFIIEPAVKQKGEFWSVIYRSNCDDVPENYLFYISPINGVYRLNYNLSKVAVPDED